LPSEFKVINITRNSITLSWKKNFDGGDPQRFMIRYRKDTVDPTYKYVETGIVTAYNNSCRLWGWYNVTLV